MDVVALGLAKADAKKNYTPRVAVKSTTPRGETAQMPSGRRIIGVDSPRSAYFIGSNFGLNQIGTPNLTGVSYGSDKTWPTGVTNTNGMAKMLYFKGNYYLQADASGVGNVYRAAPSAGTFTWSASLATMASGGICFMPAFSTDGSYLYWAEYGDPVGGPSLRRSSDGTTWTTVLGPLSTSRHIHAVTPDPYNPGHVYLTAGDVGSPGFCYKSTDNGATWAVLSSPVGTTQAWQAVEISFTPTHIYFASDSLSWIAFRIDRATLTPEWVAPAFHGYTAVPGGTPGRRVTDLATTSGSTTVTSATAAFTANDVGALIRTNGQNYIPIPTFIASVTNATTVVMTKPSVTTATGVTAVISGEIFGQAGYYGAIDPATGIYYFASLNGAIGGTTSGLFAIFPDGKLLLLDVLSASPDGELFIADGYVWVRGFQRPLLTL